MRSPWLPILTGLVILSGCAGEQPTAPANSATTPFSDVPAAVSCPTPTMIRAQITALFPPKIKLAAGQAFYLVIQAALAKNNVPLAQQVMFTFLKYALYEYQHGGLIGGTSATTQANLTTLTASLYCVVGLPAPVIPPSALGPDGAIAIVDPSSPTTTLVTATGTAGTTIPAGAAPVQTIITITRLPDSPGPLLTPLDQYPAYYQYTASPPVTFTQDVVVGVCQVPDFLPPDFARLRIAHNVPDPGATTIEILPLASATFLNPTICNSPFGLLDRRGGVLQYVMGAFSRIARDVLLPEAIQATSLGTCCLGGTTKKFSPFGAVDTLLSASAVSPSPITGPAGGAVPAAQLPSVRVVTPTGRPVQGLTVTFSAALSGQGTITGGTQLTDANGVATVGSWTLGGPFSPDTVYATVSAPHPGSGVVGGFLFFVAQPSATILPFGSGGYRNLLLGSSPAPSGFEAPGFDFSAWPTSTAPFGSAGGCSIASGVVTSWPAAANTSAISDILVRHSFPVPTGWSAGAVIRLLIDNDARVFINGTEETDGFATHEGCADAGSLFFLVPASHLNPGSANEIVIQGRDRGGESYLDVKLDLDTGS